MAPLLQPPGTSDDTDPPVVGGPPIAPPGWGDPPVVVDVGPPIIPTGIPPGFIPPILLELVVAVTGQTRTRGHVTLDRGAVSGATVVGVEYNLQGMTDSDGIARFPDLAPGVVTLVVSHGDYATQSNLAVTLSPAPTSVTLERKAFKTSRLRTTAWLTRHGWNLSQFLDAGMIDSVICMLFKLKKGPGTTVISTFSRKGPVGTQAEFTDGERQAIVADIHSNGALAFAKFGYAVPSSAAFQPMNDFLFDPIAQAALKQEVLDEVATTGWDGVSFDVENIGSLQSPRLETLRDAWTTWLRDLSAALHAQSKLCIVTAPDKTDDNGSAAAAAAHDWRALVAPTGAGAPVDWIVAMGYDDKQNMPLAWQSACIDYAASTCGLDRFVLGVDKTHSADATVNERAQLCADKRCGFGLWTLSNSPAGWAAIAAILNTGVEDASFTHQPVQTPDAYLDVLNLKSPPEPT